MRGSWRGATPEHPSLLREGGRGGANLVRGVASIRASILFFTRQQAELTEDDNRGGQAAGALLAACSRPDSGSVTWTSCI